ncbi:MAG: cell division protein FtsZ [Candidatus Paceibacterota bacterium]
MDTKKNLKKNTLKKKAQRKPPEGKKKTESSKIKEKKEDSLKSFSSILKSISVKVIGVGGGGNNVVSRMKEKRLEGVQLVAINTDLQGLRHSKADVKLQIGKNLCRGLGAGMDPERGQKAAEENIDEIVKIIEGTDLIFLTAGLGGGTGSGASPVIANLAKQKGALVVAVVTKPFSFEGEKRTEIAEEAWSRLYNEVDAIVTISNDKVFTIIDEKTPILEAFAKIDDILKQGVESVVQLIAQPGLINLDFNNIKTILSNAGSALMGIGRASGEERAKKAAQMAISSPLLEISIDGATRVLFNILGSRDLSLIEINDAARIITQAVSKDAQIIFGAGFDNNLRKGEIKITVIAGGFQREEKMYPSSPLEIKIPVLEETSTELAKNNQSLDGKSEDEEEAKEDILKKLLENQDYETPAFLRKKKK